MRRQTHQIRRSRLHYRELSPLSSRDMDAKFRMGSSLELAGLGSPPDSYTAQSLEETAFQIGLARPTPPWTAGRQVERQGQEGWKRKERQWEGQDAQGACLAAANSCTAFRPSAAFWACSTHTRANAPQAIGDSTQEEHRRLARGCAKPFTGCKHPHNPNQHQPSCECGQSLRTCQTTSPTSACCQSQPTPELENLPGGSSFRRPSSSGTAKQSLATSKASMGVKEEAQQVDSSDGETADMDVTVATGLKSMSETLQHFEDPSRGIRRCRRTQCQETPQGGTHGLHRCRCHRDCRNRAWRTSWWCIQALACQAVFDLGRQEVTLEYTWQWPDSLTQNPMLSWLHSSVRSDGFQSPWAASWNAFLDEGIHQVSSSQDSLRIAPPHKVRVPKLNPQEKHSVSFVPNVDFYLWEEDHPEQVVTTQLPHHSILSWTDKPWRLRPA